MVVSTATRRFAALARNTSEAWELGNGLNSLESLAGEGVTPYAMRTGIGPWWGGAALGQSRHVSAVGVQQQAAPPASNCLGRC
jgi:hypothetical protein